MRSDNLAYMVEIELAKNVNNKIIPHHFLIEAYHEILTNLGRMDDVMSSLENFWCCITYSKCRYV